MFECSNVKRRIICVLIFIITLCISETKFFRHATEEAANLDLESQNGIVCVSGDGVLVEVKICNCDEKYDNDNDKDTDNDNDKDTDNDNDKDTDNDNDNDNDKDTDKDTDNDNDKDTDNDNDNDDDNDNDNNRRETFEK